MESDYISLSEAQDAMTAENLIYNLDQVENGDAHRFARAAIRVLERLKPADVRPVRPCDGCPFCVCEKYGVICPSDPDFRCDTRGGVNDG